MKLSIESPRLTVRTMEEKDATERYASWLNDPEVNRYLGTKGATVEELRDYIRKWDESPEALFFGIFLKDDVHIGTVKLEPIDMKNMTTIIGIMIGDKESWGQRYSGEAMKAVINWCFETLELKDITLGVVATHTRAIRAYEKLGFEGYEVVPKCLHYGDEIHDKLLMRIKNPTILA